MDDKILDGVKAFLDERDQALEELAHLTWSQYTSFLKEGFTEQQAIDLTKTILTTIFGG